jgi:glycogen synthase
MALGFSQNQVSVARMKETVILMGPHPPPYGGVAIFTSALFEFMKDKGVKLWAVGEGQLREKNVSFMNYRRLGLVPLLLRDGFKARIVDSFHFLVEYPNIVLVPLWVALKQLLRFRWIKVVHDGSLPARHDDFGLPRKLLFRIAIGSVDEFVVVNEELNTWLRNGIGIRQKVTTINALLPIPEDEFNAALPAEVKYAIAQFSKRVVTTGVFIPSYGFKQVAEGVERIRRKSGENIGLILIDGAYISNDEYRSEVLKKRDWIIVLEKIPHPHVLQIFKMSNVFVRGCRHEGYGLSRIEAIWCGIPVVAARGEESRGMLMYDFDDVEALIRQINRALSNSSKQEVLNWGAVFQREAEENLKQWQKIMGVA